MAAVLCTTAIPSGAWALNGRLQGLIQFNALGQTGTIGANGEHAEIVVQLGCTAGQRFRVDVTLTQESTGASGEGHTQAFCTGNVENIPVRVQAKGNEKFAAETVQATADAVNTFHGKTVDTRHWGPLAITLQ